MALPMKLTEKNIQKVCRICLKEGNLNINLFEELHRDDCYVEKLLTCTLIKFEEINSLPKRICTTCVDKLNNSYEFAKLCEENNAILMNFYESRGCFTCKDVLGKTVTVKPELNIHNTIKKLIKGAAKPTENGKLQFDSINDDVLSLSSDGSDLDDSNGLLSDLELGNGKMPALSDYSDIEIDEYDSEFDSDSCFSTSSKENDFLRQFNKTEAKSVEEKGNEDLDKKATKSTRKNNSSEAVTSEKSVKNEVINNDVIEQNTSQDLKEQQVFENTDVLILEDGTHILPFDTADMQNETILVVEDEKDIESVVAQSQNQMDSVVVEDNKVENKAMQSDFLSECVKLMKGPIDDKSVLSIARSIEEYLRMSESDKTGTSEDDFNQKGKKRKRKQRDFEEDCSSDSTIDGSEFDLENPSKLPEIQSKLYSCEICNKTFNFEYNLKRHVNTHVNQTVYTCGTCQGNFTHWQPFVKHVAEHSENSPPFLCWCSRKYAVMGKFSTHLKTHFKNESGATEKEKVKPKTDFGNLCDVCGKTFKTRRQLEEHHNIHTGVKNYQCNVCGKLFRQKLSLNMHAMIHTGTKKYVCEQCGRRFRQSSHLRHHIKVHENNRDYICKHCNKGFTCNGNLQAHLRVHDAKDKYSCFVCESTFFDDKRYLDHLREHELSFEADTKLALK